MKRLFFAFLILYGFYGFSQTTRISFTYDIAGNQIKRELCLNCTTSRTPSILAKNSEELKEEDLLKFAPEDVISYYPNPVKEELYLKWELIDNNVVNKIEIYSLDGKLMYQTKNLDKVTDKTILFQEFPTGTYSILFFYSNGEQKSITIIKQ